MKGIRQNFLILICGLLGPVLIITNECFAQQFLNAANKNEALKIFQDEETQEALERTAKKLHKSAIKKFRQGRYWDCAVDLTAILDFRSDYANADEVTYHLANSLYELQMYDSADRMYRNLLKNYPKTALVAEAILGLQKVWYQKQDYHTSLRFYKALESHYSDYINIDESRYYAGQTHFHSENYSLALNILKQIKKKDYFYSFGLYTIGLIDLKKKA